MKRIALSVVVLTISCGGGSKNTPKPVEPEPTAKVTPKVVAKPAPPDEGGYKLLALADLSYTPLSPEGPESALVHGELTAGSAMFLKVAPGGSAGVHTHTADYHAVVVSGGPRHWLAGGDKKAKPLAPGSYWFQPGGQPHGDDCPGKEPCVLFIIMAGAFDFTPTPKAKAGKPGKYKFTARKDMKFAPADPTKPDGMKLAVVHGDPQSGPVGFVMEVPPKMNAGLHRHTADYHALVLDGAPTHWLPHHKGEGEPLTAGTYWFQPGGYDHGDHCTSDTACHAFVYMDQALDFLPPGGK